MPRPPGTPGELLAALPAHLGRPLAEGEAVLIGWTDLDPTLAVVLSLDLRDSEVRDEVNLVRQAVVDGAEQAALVVASHVTTGGPPAAWAHGEAVARYMGATAARYGLDLLDALVVVGDRYRSAGCADPLCCPPEGRPMPNTTPTERGTPAP